MLVKYGLKGVCEMEENVTETSTVPAPHRSPTPELHAAYTSLELLVAFVAIVGNAMVVHVFRRDRRLRRRTNYYIVSLAVADLLVGLIGIPFAILASVGLPRNLHACLFTCSLLVVLCTISIFCLVAVSVDRYWAILYPMCYSRNVRNKTAIAVVGGKPVKIEDFPFTARITDGQRLCGAVVVHEQYLIASGVCGLAFDGSSEARIIVGTDNAENGGDYYEIEKVFLHPKYDRTTWDYNVAVLKLKKKMAFGKKVQAIKMAEPDYEPKAGEVYNFMGFGLTEKDELSPNLRKIEVPYYDLEACKKMVKKLQGPELSDRYMCAGGEDKVGACAGDNGGALTYNDTAIAVSCFVVEPCGSKGYPSGFFKIGSVRPFIDDIIHKEN